MTEEELMKKKIKLCICIAIIAMVVLDFVNPPLWWQFEAQKDKHAAIEYVKTKYPEAKFKKGYYKTTEFRPGASKPYNQFIFEDSGMRFGVFVSEGRIAGDFYWEAYAEHQFYNTYHRRI